MLQSLYLYLFIYLCTILLEVIFTCVQRPKVILHDNKCKVLNVLVNTLCNNWIEAQMGTAQQYQF